MQTQLIQIQIIKIWFDPETISTYEKTYRDTLKSIETATFVFRIVRSLRNYYNDVIMSTMASQITSLTIVYSTVYSTRRSKKTSKLCVTGLCDGRGEGGHRWPMTGEFPHKGPVTRNMFPFDDVIMFDGYLGSTVPEEPVKLKKMWWFKTPVHWPRELRDLQWDVLLDIVTRFEQNISLTVWRLGSH